MAQVSFRRIPNSISISFVNERTGKRETVYSHSGRNIHDHFFKKCDKKHHRDYDVPQN